MPSMKCSKSYWHLMLCIISLVIASSILQNSTAELNETTKRTPSTLRLPPPPKVKVNKCCLLAQHLDITTQSCVPGNSPYWVPLVFLINKGQYFNPKGQSPKFMSFEENARPVLPANEIDEDQSISCSASDLEQFTGADNIALFSNGSLYLRERSLFIEPRHYCVDHEVALVCFPHQLNSRQQLKLSKCCSPYGSYNITAGSCHNDATGKRIQPLPVNQTIFQTIYGFPKCIENSSSIALAGDFAESQLDNKTGELKLQHKSFSLTDFCMEYVRKEEDHTNIGDDSVVKIFTCTHHFAKDVGVVVPATATVPTGEQFQVAVLNIGITISVIFLAATLIAAYMLPPVHHALHWRCQTYYVFCLFMGDLLLAYTQLSSQVNSNHRASVACTVIACIMHFFFLAAFFWLNTMCFNIWWAFRYFRPSSLERNQEIFRLRLYSAYAWGIPFLIATLAVTIDQLDDTDLLKPGFGVQSCWFSGENLEIFAYFFGPVGILLCANIMLFVSTTHQLTCGLWKSDDVKSTTEKTAIGKVCLKLVIVMGVTWIADVISWIVGGPHEVWFFTDLINALQGVFIFLVVGCQPQVWLAFKNLCCSITRQRPEVTNTTNGAHHSSSSHGIPSPTQNTSMNTTMGGGSTLANQTKIPMETVC